jgi:hypothetical protein
MNIMFHYGVRNDRQKIISLNTTAVLMSLPVDLRWREIQLKE